MSSKDYCDQSFTIHEVIGSGSFATVYKAVEYKNGSELALKIVDKTLASPEQIEAAHQEAAFLHRLDHPNIIKLLDYFETDTNIVLVLTYV